MSKFFLPLWALVLAACQVSVPDPACTPGPKEKAAWSQATKANTSAAYKSYLAKYPAGCYASDAAKRLKLPTQKPNVSLLKVKGSDAASAFGAY